MARILVVDQTLSVREALVFVLELEGHEATAAATGHEALDLLSAEPFDVVLVDPHLPDLPFPAFCAQLRAIAPSARVVVMSLDLSNRTTAESCAPAAFLAKPFAAPTLLDVVAGPVS